MGQRPIICLPFTTVPTAVIKSYVKETVVSEGYLEHLPSCPYALNV